MPLTIEAIRAAKSDKDLFDLLSHALQEALPPDPAQTDSSFVRKIRALSPGLRAMAATHELDVSMALDDVIWHFSNWHDRELAQETLAGLRELEATEAAELFEAAFKLAIPHWDMIGSDGFKAWYALSPLDEASTPLNDRMWAICGRSKEYGLMSYWLEYARRYPERVVSRERR